MTNYDERNDELPLRLSFLQSRPAGYHSPSVLQSRPTGLGVVVGETSHQCPRGPPFGSSQSYKSRTRMTITMTTNTEVPQFAVEDFQEDKMILRNVRILFPALWFPAEFDGDLQGYQLKGLMPKDAKEHLGRLKGYLDEVVEERGLANEEHQEYCVKTGKSESVEEGHYVVTVRSKKFPPRVFTPEMVQLTEETEKWCYGGSYCDIMVKGWASKHKKSGKVFAGLNLLAVQHKHDGERLSGGAASDTDVEAAFGAAPRKPDIRDSGTGSLASPARHKRPTQDFPDTSGPKQVQQDDPDDFDDDIPF